MKDEVESGIRNALERGYTLDEAMQSFINAGYNPVEVKEAGSLFSAGATSIVQSKPTASIEVPAQVAVPPVAQQQENPPKRPKNLVLVIILTVILLGLIGAITYLLLNGKTG